MNETPVRIFGGLCVLVLLWIGVYWWWEPRDARISFADMQSGAEAAPAEGLPRVSPSRVIPPSFAEYAVVEGDKSLQDISRKVYGTPDHWRAIARANPLMDPARLRPGRVVRIPADPANVQGKVERGQPSPGGGPAVSTEYVVLDGDTLSSISQQFYGTTSGARTIFEHNRERLKLKSMDSIRAGQTLVIPPLP